jgi:nickel-dependent lactate racemase
MKIELPELLWYGNSTLAVDLPDDWEVTLSPMRGAGRKALTTKEMEAAVNKPIGSPTLKELAKGKKRAVIIFDDFTRPTRIDQIAPIVIRELVTGGINEDDITFVCALGNHGALTNHEFRKKLGDELLEKFRVFNHNPYENCEYVGTTSRGTKVMVNKEVMQADLKIGIGCVTAHPQTGFSGGGKIVLPGVAHYDSSSHYHIQVYGQDPATCGLGNFDKNVMRFDIEEAGRLASLDFKIDAIFNDRGQTTALFAGDFMEEHKEAVKLAKDVYAADPRPKNNNLVLCNAFAKANEMAIAILCGGMSLENFSGTIVIFANAPEGQVTHYLLRSFGRDYGGRQYPVGIVPPSLSVIIVAPHPERNFGDWVRNPEVITFARSWDEILPSLSEKFGKGTRVGVLHDATMMYFDS